MKKAAIAFVVIHLLLIKTSILFVGYAANEFSDSESNAAYWYEKATTSAQKASDEIIKERDRVISEGWVDPSPDLLTYLTDHAPAFAYLEKGARLTQCEWPTKETQESVGEKGEFKITTLDYVSVSELLALSRFYLAAGLRVSQENQSEYLKRLILVQRIGHHYGQGMPQLMMGKLFEKVYLTHTYNLITRVFQQHVLSRDILQEALLNLRRMDESTVSFGGVLQRDKESYIKVVQELRRWGLDKLRKRYFWQLVFLGSRGDPEKAVTELFDGVEDLISEYLDFVRKAIDDNNPKLVDDKVDAFLKNAKQLSHDMGRPATFFKNSFSWRSAAELIARKPLSFISKYESEAMRTVLIGTSISHYKNLVKKYLMSRAYARILLASTAVLIFEIDHSSVPQKLDDLVPTYLKRVPLDPFGNGAPLQFQSDKESWRVYSIGPDYADDGGKLALKLDQIDAKGDVVFSNKNNSSQDPSSSPSE